MYALPAPPPPAPQRQVLVGVSLAVVAGGVVTRSMLAVWALQRREAIDFSVLRVDVETLGIVPISSVYERVADRLWRATHDDTVIEFEVDEFGLPRDIDGQYRRS